MEVLHDPPKTTSFTPLADHQSATPASFYTGPPVLHYHSARSKLIILSSDLANCAPLSTLTNAYTTASKHAATTNGHSTSSSTSQPAPADGAESSNVEIPNAEIWVTSSKFLIYSPIASTGLAIPYPTISLHAIQSLPSEADDESQQGIYMQLNSSSINPTGDNTGDEEDEEEESVSLTIIPSPVITTTGTASADPPSGELDTSDPSHPPPTQTTLLFNALSACSNLHPDPQSSSEDPGLASSSLFQAGLISAGDTSGGLPPAMPGSGGWITAENMHEYVDEEGNWIGRDEDEGLGEGETEEGQTVPLGPGAGTVRTRAPEDGDEVEDDAAVEGTEETKWQRTS